jgi:hypothetical protein
MMHKAKTTKLRKRYGRARASRKAIVLNPSNPLHADVCQQLADDAIASDAETQEHLRRLRG